MAKKKGVDGLVPSTTPYFATNEQNKTTDKPDVVDVTREDPMICKKCGQKLNVQSTRVTHRWCRCETEGCKEFQVSKKVIRSEAIRMLEAKQEKLRNSQQGTIRETYRKHAAREDM